MWDGPWNIYYGISPRPWPPNLPSQPWQLTTNNQIALGEFQGISAFTASIFATKSDSYSNNESAVIVFINRKVFRIKVYFFRTVS